MRTSATSSKVKQVPRLPRGCRSCAKRRQPFETKIKSKHLPLDVAQKKKKKKEVGPASDCVYPKQLGDPDKDLAGGSDKRALLAKHSSGGLKLRDLSENIVLLLNLSFRYLIF